ncbi:GNAT family N-acetyltransferase [Lichenicola cladoniae]|uniref:GNAT family N-acetyltransferase n=1 Tax=Lichenicola cladoniae TaxID=1484109 RepID=A0A6M8HMU9_9PROT|nr:GNAT family N-acetyltransferase [Lichenicola cladoniae]NPD67081.1 GNAT family N-acetyltransferase [Acetobacteraceae bacterium]QKE89621.1 GNAT family N-acetyltransferase [Lichenicola cladoniae]
MKDPLPDTRSIIVRSEAVQRKAWRLLSHAAPPDLVDTLGIQYKEVGSTLYQGALGVPGAQFNKVFSFGLDGDLTASSVAAAADWLGLACCERSLLMVPAEGSDTRVDGILLANRFQRFPLDIAIFHMDATDMPDLSRSSGIHVGTVGLENAAEFGGVLSEGLEAPAAASWLATFAIGRPGLTAYLAYEGSVPVGAAALFIDGEWGWLFIAAVRPDYRNRGAQTALLARRLEDGRKAGVRTFNIGALRPAPGHGDVFASYRNIERAGFKLAYNRPNYILPSIKTA